MKTNQLYIQGYETIMEHRLKPFILLTIQSLVHITTMKCNVKLRKLLSTHKSHVSETSLFTGAIPYPIRNSQTSHFVSVPGQNPERSSRGDSVVLRLQ